MSILMPHLLLNQGNIGWDREMGKRGDGDKLAIPGFVRCGYKNSSLEGPTAPSPCGRARFGASGKFGIWRGIALPGWIGTAYFFFSCNRFPHDSTYVELPPTQKKNEGVRFPQKKKKKNCRRNFKNLFVSQESLLPIIFHSFPPSFFCVFAVEFLLLWCCSRSDGRESTRARSEIKVILPPPSPTLGRLQLGP